MQTTGNATTTTPQCRQRCHNADGDSTTQMTGNDADNNDGDDDADDDADVNTDDGRMLFGYFFRAL
jgi:hypothetical protein